MRSVFNTLLIYIIKQCKLFITLIHNRHAPQRSFVGNCSCEREIVGLVFSETSMPKFELN